MMKKPVFISALCVFVLLVFGMSSISHAQLREDQPTSSDFTGPVLKQNPSQGANLSNLFNMEMSHSYSMMFSNFGGQTYNMNAYTNTMQFFFSDNLTGRVDMSVLHSPFGNSFASNSNGMNTQFMIRNAELNYQLSEKSNIRIQFQQVPAGYGMSPWSTGFHRSPYNSTFDGRNF
jgi:hypothetical protein